jgi:type IX secretion system PorP/SprF family membrane protein
MYNKFLSNPAYAGSEDALEVSLLHRSQYVNLSKRSIASQGFNFNLPVQIIHAGVGLTLINDFIGFQRSTNISVNYDYRKKFVWGKMGIGIGIGLIETSLDGRQLQTPEGNYNAGPNHNDDLLPTSLLQGIAPDFSFGIHFNNERFYAGGAITHMALSFAKLNLSENAMRLIFSRNIFFTGGYDFVTSKKLHILPSAFIKTDLKKAQADISVTFTIIENIITGLSLRGYTKNMIDALSLFLGVRYKNFQAVYSYDASMSYMVRFSTGSHEISLKYQYPIAKKVGRGHLYHNPRFN